MRVDINTVTIKKLVHTLVRYRAHEWQSVVSAVHKVVLFRLEISA